MTLDLYIEYGKQELFGCCYVGEQKEHMIVSSGIDLNDLLIKIKNIIFDEHKIVVDTVRILDIADTE